MSWLVDKTLRERREISMDIFPMPQIQLGDIATIDYIMPDNVRFVEQDKRFIVHEISYVHSSDGLSQRLRLVEV
jgi:hypothetical protein